ncbi:DNA-binding protein [Rhodoferax koreense]|uniref:DNA-binding protein n=1 Tax=Rhodoferax koreensis TaxID=1842727 RepID=A0A1P8JQ07_9BURK|nr:PLP-dependent aminotransferase family protein [Rhodoferax koreense]APW35821.1 DNA-binding protein [Rhodoferax koreense]
MELHVVIEGDKDLTGQLVRQLREAVRAGRLAPGAKLPPSRLLAEQLGLSRKTVNEAYARLTYDRVLIGRVGSGTFVAGKAVPQAPAPQRSDFAGADMLARWRGLHTPLRHAPHEGGSRFEYIGGAPDRKLFPQAEWRRCVMQALRESSRSRGLYGPTEGLPALREAIARHVAFSRGVRCGAADIIVTNGAQQAFDLVARVLVAPGATVAVEEPGYPPVRALFEGLGAHVVGVPVDGEGLQAERIPDGTCLIYVTPAHHFPLGMPMSTRRREALLARAEALGALVVEDDYDSEFRYEGRPNDALQSLDRHGRVAFVGSFSKTISPELRLGYLIAPPAINEAVAAAKHLVDWHTALPAQAALAKFIDEGELLKHIRRCHAVYAARRERLMQRFAADLAPWLELVPTQAGFHMAALARRTLDMDMLLKLTRRVDVGLYSIDGFYHFSPPRQGLMLGFGVIATEDIDTSLDRLRDILQQMG